VQVVFGQVTSAVQGHHGERKHHHACRFRPNLQYYLVALGVALQQGTSFIYKYHLIADAPGCQCKLYLGRSPLLHRSTTVNILQVHTKLAIPFNSRSHLGHLSAFKTCLCGKRKHLFFSEAPGPKAPGPKWMQSVVLQGHHCVQKHHHSCWLAWRRSTARYILDMQVPFDS